MNSNRYYEEDEGFMLQGVSLVALGGMVGLTAAAAARWLNGGDFQLLPNCLIWLPLNWRALCLN